MDMRVYLIYFLCLNLFEGGLSTSMIGENVFLRLCEFVRISSNKCGKFFVFVCIYCVRGNFFYSDRKTFTNTESDLLPISNFVLRYLHRRIK